MKNLVPVEVSQYLIREINVKYDTFENGTRYILTGEVANNRFSSKNELLKRLNVLLSDPSCNDLQRYPKILNMLKNMEDTVVLLNQKVFNYNNLSIALL